MKKVHGGMPVLIRASLCALMDGNLRKHELKIDNSEMTAHYVFGKKADQLAIKTKAAQFAIGRS